jgi:4-diphosphocytidyl-2-C-methyl-D-erythritol kinase
LLALNHLWQLGLTRQRLQEIGLALGADVPVFVFGRNAFAEGIGESLQAMDLPPSWFVVLEPPVQVPTARIFSAPELRRNTPPVRITDWHCGLGGNDLEPVAAARFPAIAEAIHWLSQFGRAQMSGSGACVFAEFQQREAADAVLQRLPAGMRGWVARGLDRHPLLDLAA